MRTRSFWQAGLVVQVGREEFEALVGDALDAVPAELLDMLDNIVFLVEDEPPTDDPTLLGVYEGTPITARGPGWEMGALPDRVIVYRGPLLRMCRDLDELVDEVAITVIHEIAHHVGISDARLHELGWG